MGKNDIVSHWSIRICACFQHNSKTSNSGKFYFVILDFCHGGMVLEMFHIVRKNSLYTEAYKRNANTLWRTDGISS